MVPVCFRRREGHLGRDFRCPMDSHATPVSAWIFKEVFSRTELTVTVMEARGDICS